MVYLVSKRFALEKSELRFAEVSLQIWSKKAYLPVRRAAAAVEPKPCASALEIAGIQSLLPWNVSRVRGFKRGWFPGFQTGNNRHYHTCVHFTRLKWNMVWDSIHFSYFRSFFLGPVTELNSLNVSELWIFPFLICKTDKKMFPLETLFFNHRETRWSPDFITPPLTTLVHTDGMEASYLSPPKLFYLESFSILPTFVS